jgi:predicted secreted protein
LRKNVTKVRQAIEQRVRLLLRLLKGTTQFSGKAVPHNWHTLVPMVNFGVEDDGREIEVRPQDEFEIHLPETRTAGYRWSAERTHPACTMIGEHSEAPAGTVGGSGLHHFHFRALHPGTGEIALHYGRSWEKEKGPAKTFTLKVHVRP